MTPVLQLALQGLQADMARLDQIAANLANVQTPGFKREAAHAPSFAQQVDAASATALPGSVFVDATPGSLRFTGRSLDLALTGPGWFEVATDKGLAYTRHGEFRVDAQGRLVTPQGHAVMGTAGEIRLAHGEPVIDVQGRVFEGRADSSVPRKSDDAVAQLKVVQVAGNAPFERLGNGLVRLFAEPEIPAGTAQPEIRQGHLENSNVDPTREMVQLVQAMRHAETLQKVALGYDDMLGGAIRRLGELS
jgi:flagellar basal-body rod protein FlgF